MPHRPVPSRAPGAPPAKFPAPRRRPRRARYDLCLYIAGHTPRSATAIANVRRLCDQHLGSRYSLEVIDVSQQPIVATQAQIIAVPTLLKRSPKPVRRIIGDLTNRAQLIRTLDLPPRRSATPRSTRP